MRRRTIASLATVAALAATVAVAGVSSADRLTILDSDDSPGGFDILSIRHSHVAIPATGQELLRHRIRTAEPWSPADLLDGDSFEIWFNLDDDAQPERRLTIASELDGTLYAEMENEATGRIRGYAKVWMAKASVLLVEFTPRLLARHLGEYRWYAFSSFHEEGHPDCGSVDDMWLVCGDRAPNRGWVLHEGVR